MRGSAAFRVAVAPGGALAGPWVQNSLWTAARAVPSLDLRFADNKSLVDATTGASLVTFTRASTGTFVGSDGVLQTATTNEPRFDHNPTTGESLGLLVEESRTNLLLRSEEFDNASWVKLLATASANAISAPNGTTTADKLEETSGTGEHLVYQVRTGSNETVTLSVFCKQAERTRVRLGFSNFATEGTGAIYDLVSGSVVSTSASGIDYTNPSASISAFGNGWFRCVFTVTKGIINTTNNPFVETVTGTSFSFAGTAGSGIYLWGAQLEAGAFPTSYIPTTTATVTRAADVASITGSNFSSWYNQTEGTIYSVATATSSTSSDSTATAVGIAAFTDGTNTERIRHGALTYSAIWVDNNTTQANLSSGAFTQNQQIGLASAYKVNDFAFVRDGGSVQTDATGTLPTLTQVELGRSAVASGLFNGTIKRLTYWPTRFANTTPQKITQP